MGLMDPPKAWPEAPAERGKSYGVMDPIFKNQMLAVMTMETWTDFGTQFEQQKRLLRAQNEAVVGADVTIKAMTQQLADLREKHDNLRDAVRKERLGKATKQQKDL